MKTTRPIEPSTPFDFSSVEKSLGEQPADNVQQCDTRAAVLLSIFAALLCDPPLTAKRLAARCLALAKLAGYCEVARKSRRALARSIGVSHAELNRAASQMRHHFFNSAKTRDVPTLTE